jgi:heat shock protein HslJ
MITACMLMAGTACADRPDDSAAAVEPAPAAVPIEAIAGRKWIVDSLRPSPDNAFAWSRLGISLELDAAARRASGFGGCNRWFAAFTSDAQGSLSFGPAGSTKMACMEPVGAMEMEQAFFDRLQTVASYRLSEDHLYLESDDGASGMVLILDDADSP